MVSRRGFLTALSAGLCASRGVRGQGLPRFHSDAELVVLHVTVREKRGTYVTGLAKDAFAVVDNGQRQVIQLFSSEDAPVTAGLLVDGSGSMQPNREGVIAAAVAFAEASHPADEMCALVFDDDVRAALPPDAPFTTDRVVLRDALVRAIHARGRTALYDGIAAGLRYVDRGRYARKVLAVVSDGGDNASTTMFREILREAQASNTVIYTVALVDPLERDANPRLLGQIAKATGGEAFVPRDVGSVPDVLRRIAQDIRHTYTIGYVPSRPASAGEFRPVKVLVQPARRESYVVRARTGYLTEPSENGREP